jgi:hypothetical protein
METLLLCLEGSESVHRLVPWIISGRSLLLSLLPPLKRPVLATRVEQFLRCSVHRATIIIAKSEWLILNRTFRIDGLDVNTQ